MKYSLIFFSLFIISNEVSAQLSSENLLALESKNEIKTELADNNLDVYFEDIVMARRKIGEIKQSVENNFENKRLSEKKYRKQNYALNNMLLNLKIIEERRIRLLTKRKYK